MLITAAAVFHTRGLDELGDDLEAVHAGLNAIIRNPTSAVVADHALWVTDGADNTVTRLPF
jgi:hypothetical protein